MAEKVTRLLPSQGLNRDQHDCLARLASLCGKVRTDARHPCSGVSTAPQSPYDLRDAWMAEGYARHGLPARWGKATLDAAMSPRPSAREVAKVPVQKAVRHRARGDNAECRRLYGLLKQNRWTEDPFLHWQMRKQWQGGQSVPCGERDRGRRRFLHHQGLTRTGLDPSAVPGPRPTHRHPAQGHTPVCRHPPHPPAGHASRGSVLRSRRGCAGRGCAIFWRGCMARRLRCTYPAGTCALLAERIRTAEGDGSTRTRVGGLPRGPHQPRANHPRRYRSVPVKGTDGLDDDHVRSGAWQILQAEPTLQSASGPKQQFLNTAPTRRSP